MPLNLKTLPVLVPQSFDPPINSTYSSIISDESIVTKELSVTRIHGPERARKNQDQNLSGPTEEWLLNP